MWLTAVSASIWAAWSAYRMFEQLDVTWATLWRITGVGLQVALVLLLCRIARAASRCRQHRSFEAMAAAVRIQRPFWALLTVAALLGSIDLAVTSMRAIDYNKAIQHFIDQRAAGPPASANTPQP